MNYVRRFVGITAASAALVVALAACSGGAAGPVGGSVAPAPVVNPDTPVAREITAFVESHGRNWGKGHAFSGYIHAEKGGELVYSRGFGFRDREAKLPNTATTSFLIGSVTKQFTAAAILLLVEQGKVALDDTVKKHIPEYPGPGGVVTVHQLLNHTSGIPSYTGMPGVLAARDKPITPTAMMKLFWDEPLEFTPGSEYRYNNSGYALLGIIIERLSKMSYAKFVAKWLFEPAKMSDTFAGDAKSAADWALGYEGQGDELKRSLDIDRSWAYAAGAVRSNAVDMAKWHRALAGTAILAESSKQKMYTPGKGDYGYGWIIGERNGHNEISHGGGIDGFLTSYKRILADDLVVIVFSNNTSVSPEGVADAVIKATYGGKLEPVPEAPRGTFDPKAAARCVGSFRMTEKSRSFLDGKVPPDAIKQIETMTVRATTAGIAIKPAGQPEFELAPSEPNTYFHTGVKVTLRCVPGDGGAVNSIEILQGGATIEFGREAATKAAPAAKGP